MCYPGCGAIFSVTPPSSSSGAWSETILYAFQGGNDGADPQAGLVVGKDGTLFGTTSAGGGSTACGSFPEVEGCGTVYSLTPPTLPGGAWTEKVLYRFVGGQDGTNPQSALAVGKGGVLYGTTYYGAGPCSLGTPLAGCGTIFSLSPPSSAGGAWSKTVLYSFQGNDGASPLGLLYGADGTLYGVANRGGNGCIAGAGANPQGCGFAFSLSPPASAGLPWTETLLHTFQSGTDGAHPNGLVFGAKSQSGFVLYGATNEGGTENSCRGYGCGTVYSLTPPTISGGAWAETILHAFPGQEGAEPEGNMAIGAGGQLYGVTSAGGEYNEGTVYVLTPPTSAAGTWTKTVLWNFQTSSAKQPQ